MRRVSKRFETRSSHLRHLKSLGWSIFLWLLAECQGVRRLGPYIGRRSKFCRAWHPHRLVNIAAFAHKSSQQCSVPSVFGGFDLQKTEGSEPCGKSYVRNHSSPPLLLRRAQSPVSMQRQEQLARISSSS